MTLQPVRSFTAIQRGTRVPATFAGLASFSYAFWVRLSAPLTAGRIIRVGDPVDAGSFAVAIRVVGSTAEEGFAQANCFLLLRRHRTATTNGVVDRVASPDGSAVAGAWLHLVASFPGGSHPQLYINGSSVSMTALDAATSGATLITSTDEIAIGDPTASALPGFVGDISRVTLFPFAMSATRAMITYRHQSDPLAWIGRGSKDALAATNHSPVAVPLQAAANSGVPKTIDPRPVGYDQNGDTVSLVAGSATANPGSVVISAGALVYTPPASFVGSGRLGYSLRDISGLTSVGRVDVVVTAAPVTGTGGPIQRVVYVNPNVGKHMLLTSEPIDAARANLSSISNLVYRVQTVFKGDHVKLIRPNGTLVDRINDHSDQGAIDHARYLYKFWKDRRAGGAVTGLWWDWEDTSEGPTQSLPNRWYVQHTNVPQGPINAGWTQPSITAGPTSSQIKWNYISVYDADAIPAYRAEAVRFQKAICKATLDFARADGQPNFEIGTYNIPGKVTDYSSSGIPNYTLQANETRSMFGPDGFSYGGHSTYFSTGALRTLSQYCDFYARCIQGIRAAYGAGHQIIPAVWARYYIPSNSSVNFQTVPANWLSTLCNAILDAGADGFIVWAPDGDGPVPGSDVPATQSQRWAEVTQQVVLARGTFVRP